MTSDPLASTTLEVEIIPTTNRWDAPVLVTQAEDGTISLARDDDHRYSNSMGPRRHVAYYPHAVIVVDGAMTAFDRERQPAVDSSDLTTIVLPERCQGYQDPTLLGLRAIGRLGRVVVDARNCNFISPSYVDELFTIIREAGAVSLNLVRWPAGPPEAWVVAAMREQRIPSDWLEWGYPEGDSLAGAIGEAASIIEDIDLTQEEL